MTNPYAPPQSMVVDVTEPGDQLVPADRITRLGASILDSIVAGVLVFLPFLFGSLLDGIVSGYQGGLGSDPSAAVPPALVIGFSFGCIGLIVWTVLTIKYVRANGQTIAKKMLRIKVVRSDGTPATLARIFWLRNALNTVFSFVPVYGFIDVLFIFGESQQCLHDRIADTIVVKA